MCEKKNKGNEYFVKRAPVDNIFPKVTNGIRKVK